MTEMVEPDRTIMIVSIIGLVIIWGSFFYHKLVQGGQTAASGQEEIGEIEGQEPEKTPAVDASADSSSEQGSKGRGNQNPRKKGKKRKR